MKNPAKYVRTSFYERLNGTVFYNSSPVPVYSSTGVSGLPFQINIMDYSDADASNKNKFRGQATQVVEIIAEQYNEAKMYVDEIGELVMNQIKPTTRSELLTGPDMQIMIEGKPSQNYLVEESGEKKFIVRLILRYNFKISEQL